MVNKTYSITEKQAKKIRKESDKTGLNKSDIVRRAIDNYFNEKDNG